MVEYVRDEETEKKVKEIVTNLNLTYIDVRRLAVVKSKGSKSKAIARVWSIPKAILVGFGVEPLYVIELVQERYDKLSEDNKLRTLLHEILHIPRSFKGGLRSHGKFVNDREVERLLKLLKDRPIR
jgi:predicted metallopeptidase